MNLKRFTYNTVSIMVAFVLVFGSCSAALAETAAEAIQRMDSQPNQTQGTFSAGTNIGGFNGSLSNGAYELNSAPASTITFGSDGKAVPTKGYEGQATNALTPPSAASSTGNGTVPGGAQGITANLVGCAAGQLLASVITTGITTALNGLNTLIGVATGAPVSDNVSHAQQNFATAVEQGFQIMGVYIGVSLNAIAYCIVNSILEYIANSTIAWANSGFNGNPAFLQNPERFFQSLADQQASQFINSLAYNISSSGLQMNVCEPFRRNVALSLANSYGRYGNNTAGVMGFANYGSCGISSQAMNNFISGKDRSNYWGTANQLFMNDNNSFIGTTLNAGDDLRNLIARTADSAKSDVQNGGGYQSSVVCVDPKDKNTCNVVVPGSTINKSLQNTLNLGQQRLVAATRFDQVVASIVNNLVRVALNKLLTPVGIGVPVGTNFIKPTYTNVPSTGQGYNNGQPVPKALPLDGSSATYGNIVPKATPVQ